MNTEFDGHLHLWDEGDLLRAEHTVNPAAVTSLRVGATCYSCVGIEPLLARLSIYKNVVDVIVADDRVQDQDMPKVKQQFEDVFPAAAFAWGYDLLVAGKHGR